MGDAGPSGDAADANEEGDAGARDDAEAASTAGMPPPAVCMWTLAVGCTPYQPSLGGNSDFSNCPPTWNDAIAFCVMYPGVFGYAQTDCGSYLRWRVENVDVGCSYYYGKASGELVAVFCDDEMCLGGPLGFTEPACAPIETQDYSPCVPNDAGIDGGDAQSTD